LVFILLLVSVPLAVAQHWDIEKVDSASWGVGVQMRWHPDGRLFLCYGDTTGVIRLASKDSIWSYEDLPQWRSVRRGTQAFDIGPRGAIGVSYVGADNRCWCALRADTGWADVPTSYRPAVPWSVSPVTLDTGGRLAVTIQVGDNFLLGRIRDTQWVSSTIATGMQGFNPGFGGSALGSMPDGVIWGVYWYAWNWPLEIYAASLNRFEVRDSQVNGATIVDGADNSVYGASGCIDRQGSTHGTCDYAAPTVSGLFLDSSLIDEARVTLTAVKYDSLDMPQIAYVTWGDALMYRYRRAGVWYVYDLQTAGVAALDLVIGENSQPLIAYTTGEGVFLARGVDIVGLSEEQQEPTAGVSRPTTTIVSSVLRLPVQPLPVHPILFDMTGRRVTDLHPGANDVSGLATGVYFVREAQAQTAQKVVVTR
jgi:hypothetical protein